ncbi:serine/threonine-protein kinase [Rhodococcus erythropolis]|uniref:serine/threonine-protein kinase n=1 Tax=Rhodococcus erythropolis TaxID=1833 RepID=UPI0024B7A5DA|nr:serine/threonine-protein kinase [Rhodococcus erythropolis]MDJ0015081.1 serine/threonine-protein kinase [Rhodococcus erythropolis]
MAAPPYEVKEVLGKGGYAVVNLAVDPASGQKVALKQVKHAGNVEASTRLVREIEAMRKYEGSHVMPLIAADQETPWYSMPIARGTLADLRDDLVESANPNLLAADVFRAVAAGLAQAHIDGAVHRDITPKNILILEDHETGDDRWVLADWGLFRRASGETTHQMTVTGLAIGTPGYYPPEAHEHSHRLDERADLYSLGRVLSWVISGNKPIGELTNDVEGPLRQFVRTCTSRDRSSRFPTMKIALEALELAITPSVARLPSTQVAELVRQAASGADVVTELQLVVMSHLDEELLFINELGKLNGATIRTWVQRAPESAADAATQMCKHLLDAGSDGVSWEFNLVNRSLKWSFTVLAELGARKQFGLLEDVAIEFCRAEEYWFQFEQLRRTRLWMRGLTGEAGAAVARAITHSGTTNFYIREVGCPGMPSSELNELIGS